MNYPRLKAIYEHKGMKALPIKTGQLLEIHEIVPQGDSTRISKFKGLVIQVKNPSSPTGTFTIRGASPLGRGTLERVFPLGYHKFDKVILLDAYKIRRSKIFYIREKIGKDAKMKSVLSSTQRDVVLTA